jgi:tetratricopeptide (TPR) repeat protein
VLSFYRAAGLLILAAGLTATQARAEDLDCTKYVPQIGKTVRVPCNDTPATPPPAALEPQSTPIPAPGSTPSESHESDTRPCFTEENPGTAMRICQDVLNKGSLSQATKTLVYNRLAYASLRIKDYQGALSWSKKSLELTPSAVEHYVAGQAYAALKNPTAAIEEFSAALVLAPKYTLAFHRRGEAYLDIGDRDHAKSDFQAALALYSKLTPSLEALRRLRRRG